jgi:hypothetical protein
MIFNLSLIPIGNSYWVTATKIGSNYIKNFANPDERYLRLWISDVNKLHRIDDEWIYVNFPNGLYLKFKVFDFDNIEYTHLYTEIDLLNIFNKVSIVLTRNPFDRFKSGLVQKISELYNNISFSLHSDNLKNVEFHKDIYFDLTKYDINYSLLIKGVGVTPNDAHPLWQREWNLFINSILPDIFNLPNIDRITLSDLHTHPVYHFFYLILNGLSNWNQIKTIDINELESTPKLFINEIGDDEYNIRLGLLNNREDWPTDIDYANTLKRVSNKRLYFDSHLISEYFESNPIFIFEKIYYDILTQKKYK